MREGGEEIEVGRHVNMREGERGRILEERQGEEVA